MKRGFIYTISAFMVSVLFLSALSFLYTARLEDYIDSRDKIDSSQTLITELYRLSYYIREAETSQRSFVLNRDTAFFNEYSIALEGIRAVQDSLKRLIPERHNLRMRLNNLNFNLINRIHQLNELIVKSSNDSASVDSAMLRNYPLRTDLPDFIKEMEQVEMNDRSVYMEKKTSYERVHNAEFRTLFLFALLIFAISFIVLLREIRLRSIYHRRMENEIRQANEANKELERLTYITSHDLQEPLRKIRTFSNLLSSKHANEMNEDTRSIVQRIEHSADVMQELIRDLGNYANLVSNNSKTEKVDLSDVLDEVGLKFRLRLADSSASFRVDQLPVIKGHYDQLVLLFSALIDNSLKFAREGVAPEIVISHQVVKGEELMTGEKAMQQLNFHRIAFTDNGLGFDAEYAEKIFSMFQRLHNRDTMFAGRGMGLAIAKRVMVNHNGYIVASGKTNEGAQFFLYFPV
ncbi:MAG TPA: ATP-binding protein [Chitinophagaceae bacterium]